jgi:hypothetical protein
MKTKRNVGCGGGGKGEEVQAAGDEFVEVEAKEE